MSKAKDNKIGLYVFRLPASSDADLMKQCKERPIIGINSKHQFARKIVMDYLQGRLVYTDPAAASDNTLLRGA